MQPHYLLPDESGTMGGRLIQRWAESQGARVTRVPRNATLRDYLAFAEESGADIRFALSEAPPAATHATGTFGEQDAERAAEGVNGVYLKHPRALSPEETLAWNRFQMAFLRRCLKGDASGIAYHAPLAPDATSAPEWSRQAPGEPVHGILLPGNAYDMHPVLSGSGEALHPETSLPPLTNLRPALDMLLASLSIETHIPLLGICGGMQASLAAANIPLTQYLPGRQSGVAHFQTIPRPLPESTPQFIQQAHQTATQGMEAHLTRIMTGPNPERDTHAGVVYGSNHRHLFVPDGMTGCMNALKRLLDRALPGQGWAQCEDYPSLSRHNHGATVDAFPGDHALKVAAQSEDQIAEAVYHDTHPFFWLFEDHPEAHVSRMMSGLIREMIDASHRRCQTQPAEAQTALARTA